MKTVVYQTYRTSNVPGWITTCMQTVKGWAESNAFEYEVFDDSFLSNAPDWFRSKVNHDMCPVTDLARLVMAKKLLAQGYERTIWIDADMIVFDPAKLKVDITRDFAFCREVWLSTDGTGETQVRHLVNNSITAFCKNNVHLDFFIDACLRIARHKSHVGKMDVGTRFLSQLRRILPLPLLANVGILSPAMMAEISRGEPRLLVEYAKYLKAPLACANLCASLQGVNVGGVAADEALYESVVENLLSNRGEVVNRNLASRQPQ